MCNLITNQKFGAKTNMRLPGALSPTGRKIYMVEIPLVAVARPDIKCLSIRKTCIFDLEWVILHAYNFFVSKTKFFCSTWEGLLLIRHFPLDGISAFQRDSRSKSKVS